jgi:glycosyltransferase involved in cell wall biosynthesis
MFGTVRPEAGIEACLRAIGDLAREDRGVVLVVGGRLPDPAYRARLESVARLAGADVRFPGVAGHLMACDVVVDLDDPSDAPWSTSTWRAMAAAKPVIVADHTGEERNPAGPWPAGACGRVPTDGRLVPALAGQLRALRDDEEVRARQAAAARRGFEQHGTLGALLDAYLDVVQELTPTPVPRLPEPGRVRRRDIWEDVVAVVGA